MSLPDISTETLPGGLFNLRRKQISITAAGVEFEQPGLFKTRVFRKSWDDIDGVIYGIKTIRGIYISPGMRFEFGFKLKSGKQVSFSVMAIYGVGKKKIFQQYTNIYRWLEEFFIVVRVKELLKQYEAAGQLTFPDMYLSPEGVRLDKHIINWSDVDILDYNGYFIIKNRANPRQHKKYNYAADWYALVQYGIVHSLVGFYTSGPT